MSVIALGTFDGIHRGHRKILELAVRRAKKLEVPSAALTFSTPPRFYFFPSPSPALLTTLPEKKGIIRGIGVERVVTLEFNRALAQLSPEKFFSKFLVSKLRAKEIVVGYNFGFGKNRSGDPRLLEGLGRSKGIKIHVVKPVCKKGVPVSSGRTRKALEEGNVEMAEKYLGYPYFVAGKVVKGEGLGRRLGFPTANLKVDSQKILPPGVFVVKVRGPMPDARSWWGLCNIGVRPTFSKIAARHRKRVPTHRLLTAKSVEIHLPGYQGSLYGRELKISFIQRIRSEKKFDSPARLANQIKKDLIFLDNVTKKR